MNADMKVSTTLPAVSFDYEGLMAWAKSITEKYDGLVVQEDDIAAIKSEMAGLNKAKLQVDGARKETVREISKPIKAFESQIKEVCAVFTNTYSFLSNQVKGFEAAEREKKVQHVQFQIDSVLSENGITGLEVPIEPSWLNKTKTLKAVRAEVESFVLRHIQEQKAAAELAQAKQDRAVAIEEKVGALSASYGFHVPVSRFHTMNDLEVPLSAVYDTIEGAFDAEAARRDEQAKKDSTAQPTTPPPSSEPEPLSTVLTVTVTLSYDPAMQSEIDGVLQNLAASGVSVSTTKPRVAE